jgi:hypothetical protein
MARFVTAQARFAPVRGPGCPVEFRGAHWRFFVVLAGLAPLVSGSISRSRYHVIDFMG